MKKIIKISSILIIMLSFSLLLASCTNNATYYDEENNTITSDIDMGNVNELTLKTTDDSFTIENQKVRIILNKNGSIREYANKEAKIYLIKDNIEAIALRVNRESGVTYVYDNLSYEIVENDGFSKQIDFTYIFNEQTVKTSVSLLKDSDEVTFNLALYNNKREDSVLDIEYPILDGVDTLSKKENDVLLTPYTTGYLFKNPIDSFNGDNGIGISKSMGLYPSGWYYTMQFSAYYSNGLGGFYYQTKDSEDGIKSFSCIGSNGKLKMSVYHYIDDLKDGDTIFNYDFIISNLNEGNWYEAADKYKEWALKQPWVERGKLTSRNDYDKTLYENTSLVFFGYRANETGWSDMISIYDQISSRIDNSIFNISIYNNKKYYDIVREYNHEYVCFEFNSISDLEQFRSNTILDTRKNPHIFWLNGTAFYYQCPASDAWLEARLLADQNYINTYNVDGLYYDVSFTAVHPILCYDDSHIHGSRVNMLKYFMNQYKNIYDLSVKNEIYSVGQELITEQLLVYSDYYQARANAGLLGWMETDQIRYLIEDGCAEKISLFEYVYHEYGALRLDGYLMPQDELGNSYYYVAAYTALNGGIPEYNMEYYYSNEIPASSTINIDMVDFINKLGNIRSGIGKDYLVYGNMVRSPEIGTSSTTYKYENSNIRSTCDTPYLGGDNTIDDVVISAYKSNGKVGIFLCNITESKIDVSFILHALKYYGIEKGDIYLTMENGKSVKLSSIVNGDAKISLSLDPKNIYLLEINS